VLFDLHTVWQKVRVTWYGQGKREIEWCSGTALWDRGGQTPLPIRWVLTRDPAGKHEPRAYFSTDQAQSGLSIVTDFMKRWCAEMTFEESRAHLGVETQRQWSDKAIERVMPCLFGLYSLVALLGHRLHSNKQRGIESVRRRSPMCSARVRRHQWNDFNYSASPQNPDVILLPRSDLSRFANVVCSSA
jgi:hypothetical protein